MVPKGATLKDIKSVHSHIHALGQCRKIIRKHGWKAIVAGDTAGAAREVAEWNDRTARRARPGDRRRDLRPRCPEGGRRGRSPQTRRASSSCRRRTSAPGQQRPGSSPLSSSASGTCRPALYKAMGGFATNNVNMTKLESYQLDGAFTATQFYADVEGHPNDRNLKLALEELAFFSAEMRILGGVCGERVAERTIRRLARPHISAKRGGNFRCRLCIAKQNHDFTGQVLPALSNRYRGIRREQSCFDVPAVPCLSG